MIFKTVYKIINSIKLTLLFLHFRHQEVRSGPLQRVIIYHHIHQFLQFNAIVSLLHEYLLIVDL